MSIESVRRVVANFNRRKAGASDFYVYLQVSDAKKAFARARLEAAEADDQEQSFEGGYSGTILEKDSFKIQTSPLPLKEAMKFADSDVENNDKWGPAFCIPVLGPDKKTVIGHYFYGFASS